MRILFLLSYFLFGQSAFAGVTDYLNPSLNIPMILPHKLPSPSIFKDIIENDPAKNIYICCSEAYGSTIGPRNLDSFLSDDLTLFPIRDGTLVYDAFPDWGIYYLGDGSFYAKIKGEVQDCTRGFTVILQPDIGLKGRQTSRHCGTVVVQGSPKRMIYVGLPYNLNNSGALCEQSCVSGLFCRVSGNPSRISKINSEIREESCRDNEQSIQYNNRVVPRGFFLLTVPLFLLGIGLGKVIWMYLIEGATGNVDNCRKNYNPNESVVPIREETTK